MRIFKIRKNAVVNCLIIGYGSIGKRHKDLLEAMGHIVRVVTHQNITAEGFYNSIASAFYKNTFEYVVIANRTCDHYKTLLELSTIGYKGLILVEKPLFDCVRKIEFDTDKVFVAANLRFHPVISALPSLLKGKKLFAMQVYVGQYLPDWRPDIDYRQCYSAIKSQGGGVLRDLSHELDYTTWLAGGWKSLTAMGGKYSDLDIDSDDVFSLLMETSKCPVTTVHMNYLDRQLRREIIIHLEDMSIKGDLIANTLEINGEKKVLNGKLNNTYMDQHKAILYGDTDKLCTIEQGADILYLIEMAEEASRKKIWKQR